MRTRLHFLAKLALNAAMLYFAVAIGRVIYIEVAIAPGVRNEFNFQTDTPYAPIGPDGAWREVGELTYVASSGRLGKAGLRSGDVLANMQLYELYAQLEGVLDGHPATVDILRGAFRKDRPPERLTFEVRSD